MAIQAEKQPPENKTPPYHLIILAIATLAFASYANNNQSFADILAAFSSESNPALAFISDPPEDPPIGGIEQAQAMSTPGGITAAPVPKNNGGYDLPKPGKHVEINPGIEKFQNNEPIIITTSGFGRRWFSPNIPIVPEYSRHSGKQLNDMIREAYDVGLKGFSNIGLDNEGWDLNIRYRESRANIQTAYQEGDVEALEDAENGLDAVTHDIFEQIDLLEENDPTVRDTFIEEVAQKEAALKMTIIYEILIQGGIMLEVYPDNSYSIIMTDLEKMSNAIQDPALFSKLWPRFIDDWFGGNDPTIPDDIASAQT